jgi:integrase
MTGAEVMAVLGVLDVRERLIVRMAAFDGMRPGEIFAMRLGRLGDGHVSVEERVYSGVFDTPKGRRGKNTSRVVALAPGTIKDLQLWLALLGGRKADDFLFPSEAGSTPLRPNNLWKGRIRPRLQLIGLDWVNFQVLRRTNASLARKTNVDDKVAADQRGHTLGVSMEVYATSDLAQKIEAVNELELEVTRAASMGDRQTRKTANSSDSLTVRLEKTE